MEGLDFGCSEKVVEKSNWGQYVITGAQTTHGLLSGDNNIYIFLPQYDGHLTINTVKQSWSLP